MNLEASVYRDPDQFLESLHCIEPDQINVCLDCSRVWVGFYEKGKIVIQEYKSLDELLTFIFRFTRYKGNRYSYFIESLIADMGRTEQELIDEFLYTGKP